MASQPQKYLPEDILVNIFYRVPVESLVRCSCVCKEWHQMIRATSFVAAHLAYQKTSSNKYILYDGSSFCSLLSNFESFFDGTCRNSKLYYPLELFYRSDTYLVPKIYGICNGLLCLSNKDYCMGDNIYLCNPGCRKIKKLPELHISTKDDAGFTENVPGVSFGYYDDDYKVVVIAPVGNAYNIYVYGLGNNSWKHIHTNTDAKNNFDLFSMDTKFVLNTVYAMTYALVICFDLSDETVRVVKFPNELYCQHKTLEAYGETIAVFEYENNHPQSLNMWILRDKFSSKSSWEKKFSFELQKACDDAEAVGILDNGKYLVRTHNDAGGLITFFMCDLDFLKLTEFRSMYAARDQLPYTNGRIHLNYVESLLLLNNGDCLDPNW